MPFNGMKVDPQMPGRPSSLGFRIPLMPGLDGKKSKSKEEYHDVLFQQDNYHAIR